PPHLVAPRRVRVPTRCHRILPVHRTAPRLLRRTAYHSYGFAAGAVGPGPGPHDASSCRQSEVKCGVPEGSSVSGAPSSLPETEDETTLLHVSALLIGASLQVGMLTDSRPAHPSDTFLLIA